MNTDKYIGMDVHSETVSIAVRDSAGKLIMEATMAMETSAILAFVKGLQGKRHVTFEEGIHAAWLYELLRPQVTELLVCDPR